MSSLFHDLQTGKESPQIVNMVVENPKGIMGKFEYDEDGGYFKLDRVSYAPMPFPVEYGFIPQTRNEGDGDSLDIMCANTYPTFAGCVVEVKVLGMLKLEDTGEVDYKIIGIPTDDPHLADVEKLEDLGKHELDEIVFFWSKYKDLMPNKYIKMLGWEGPKEAYAFIQKAMDAYKKERAA